MANIIKIATHKEVIFLDKREMELLMDRYKKEMLAFSKKNGYINSDPDYQPDEREKRQLDADINNKGYERDRSDPLPENDETVSADAEPDAVPAQTSPSPEQNNSAPVYGSNTADTVDYLKSYCSSPDSDEKRRKCRDITSFLNANPDTGTLRVETFASDRAFAVPSARVMVFLPLDSGNVTIYDGITDISGSSEKIILPAPPRSLSSAPNNGKALPYSTYTVYIEHPSYVRALFNNVPVFSGIESVQPVQMLAKVDGMSEPDPIIVNESGSAVI